MMAVIWSPLTQLTLDVRPRAIDAQNVSLFDPEIVSERYIAFDFAQGRMWRLFVFNVERLTLVGLVLRVTHIYTMILS